MKRNRCVFSIDWLQVTCQSIDTYTDDFPLVSEFVSYYSDSKGNHRIYEIIEPKEFTHGYLYNKSVVWHGLVVAHLSYHPRSEHRDPRGCSVKIANATLYSGDWYFILMDICKNLMWQPIKISRCDLCCDFNFFMGGLSPETFLRKYVQRDKSSYVRVGSNKFAVYGHKYNGHTLFESIRWGSRQNGVSVYMYNKTKELQENKHKPWITNTWKAHQLSSTKDVWRVEISINSEGCGLREISSNMLHTLFVDDLATPDMVRKMFVAYAAKYFRFKHTDPKIKHAKDLKDVTLLNLDEEINLTPCTLTDSHDSGHREWMALRSLQSVQEALRLVDSPFNTKENRKSLKVVETLYENLFSIRGNQASREEIAKDIAVQRIIEIVNTERKDAAKKAALSAWNLPSSAIKQLRKEVSKKLTFLKPPSPNPETSHTAPLHLPLAHGSTPTESEG